MPKLMLKRVRSGFIPYTEESLALFKKIPNDVVAYIQITIPRNERFHRKFFGALAKVSENLNVTEETLLLFIKEELGMYKVVSVGGKIFKEYESISFAAMDDAQFGVFYDNAVTALAKLLGEKDKAHLLEVFDG